MFYMIFNILFNNIYVLNLEKSIDRKEHIEKEFKRVGIEKYEFFKATPHDSDETKNLMNSNFVKKFPNCFRCNNKRCDCENNYLTPFQIANWCSFINIFKDIIKNNHKFVLICEDDIVFTFQHKRIINKLLSKENFKNYKIDMDKPLLIRLGTAYDSSNHDNINASPIFLKNYSLCNPCFAINKEMAIVYLSYLKIIDYHSDIYFHKKIPRNIMGVQFFTMYPYPVYELSFVKSKQKFESLVRPKNGFRRKEFKEFLFLSTNVLLNIFLKNISKKLLMDISFNKIGYNGNIDTFILLEEDEKERFHFENKILLIDDMNDNIKIIHYNIIKKNKDAIKIYNLYLNKINKIYNLNLEFNDIDLIKTIVLFYKYYLELLDIKNIIKIDITKKEDIDHFSKILKIKNLDKEIANYHLCKKIFTDDELNFNIILKYDG